MKTENTLRVVPNDTELERQLSEQNRTDFVKPILHPPVFKDDSKREVKHGTLGDLLRQMSGKYLV